MKDWMTITIFIVSNIIVASSTYLIGWLQANRADKRLERQLERQREIDDTKWRREVRGEPLIILRAELAYMAAMCKKLINVNIKYAGEGDKKHEEAEIKKAVEEWEKWIDNGKWEQALLALDDTELINMATEVMGHYIEFWTAAEDWSYLDLPKKARIRDALHANPELIKIQALINQRLQEL